MSMLKAMAGWCPASPGVQPALCSAECRLSPSVGLLLTIHLCLFTIIGMLLFTIGEKVSVALAGGGGDEGVWGLPSASTFVHPVPCAGCLLHAGGFLHRVS